jgi:hypothetical protein
MKEQLIQIRNNILEALDANDNMLAKMALNDLDTLLHKIYSKDETIEEAAKNYANIPLCTNIDTEERYFNSNVRDYDSFIEGATYQKERK